MSNSYAIRAVDAWQIFDSRGHPTLEVCVTLASGHTGHGLVPSGASTGQYEALELRDGDPQRFRGKSVFKAIANVQRELAPLLVGCEPFAQEALDQAMIACDGTPGKSRLGANAILGCSMAIANAAAAARGEPLFAYLGAGAGTLLPLPEIQIFGGGAHAQWRTDIQDYLIMAVGARSFPETLEITHNVYHAAGELLRAQGRLRGVADEGGWWPEFRSNAEGLALLVEAIARAGYQPGRDVAISLDIAASDLYRDGRYHLKLDGQAYTSAEFAALMQAWCDQYPICSIEDPLADTDWDGWRDVYQRLGARVQLIGDDLYTTNLARIEQGIAAGVTNAVLIKLNQIGTVTETVAAIRRTQAADWRPVVSARSGETEDAFIAHLAVATDAGQLKVGSFARSERMVKWNEVLRIERALGERARFLGGRVLAGVR